MFKQPSNKSLPSDNRPMTSRSDSTMSNASSTNKSNSAQPKQANLPVVKPVYDKNKKFEMRFLTGTIERVMAWHQMFKQPHIYQVIAPIVKVDETSSKSLLLMRDRTGPDLKVLKFDHQTFVKDEIVLGKIYRCTGRMVEADTLHAFKIREATSSEIELFPRQSYLSQQEVDVFLAKQAQQRELENVVT